MKTLRYLGISAAVLIALLFITVLIFLQLDPNHYKGFIEQQVSELTGREFRIDGNLQIEFSLQPSIRVEKVSFANTDWGRQPDMLSLDLLQLRIQLRPLLDRQLIVEQLLLENVYLSVEQDEQGHLNWQLEKLSSSDEQSTPEPADGEPFQMPVLPVLKDIRFDTINVYYHDAGEPIESDILLDELRLSNAGIDEAINISASGQVNGHPYALSGKTEFLSEVTSENLIDQGVSIKIDADALGIIASVDGVIKHPAEASGINIDASIEAEDLDHSFTILTGQSIYQYLHKDDQALSLSLSASLSDDDRRYILSDLSVNMAGSDISGDISYRDGASRPEIIAELSSGKIDLDRILPETAEARTDDERTESSGSEPLTKITLPTAKLPLHLLGTVDAKIKYTIGEFHYDIYSPRSISLDASLSDRILEVRTFDLKLDGTPIRSSLKLDATTPPAKHQLTLGIEQLQLQSLAERLEVDQIDSGIFTAIMDLSSRGDNVDSIVRSLSGEANLRLSESVLKQAIDDRTYTANINKLEILFSGMGKPTTYRLTGAIDEQPIALDGRLDSPQAILDNSPVDIGLKLSAVKADLRLTGRIDRPLQADRAELDIDLQLPRPRQSIIALSTLIPAVELKQATPKHPTKLVAQVTAMNKAYDIKKLRLDIGQSDLSGDVSVDLTGDKPSIIADFESDLIDLNELVPATRITAQDQAPPEESPLGTKEPVDEKTAKRLFPDEPLPTLAALDEFELDLDYQLKKLTSNQQTIDNVLLHMRLKDSLLIIDPISIDFAKGTIHSRLELNTVGTPRFMFENEVIKLDYDRLMAILGTKEYARGEMDAKVELNGSGESIREMMASLDGSIRMTTVDGELNSESLKLLSKDIVSVIPFTDTSNRQKINCGVVQMNIKDGIASTHSMVINTGAISALGTGDIDLTDETLSLYVAPRTQRTSFIDIALVPVNITGPLNNPSVRPDVAGSTLSTTRTATNVGLTIATGGIWLLAEGMTKDLWSRFVDDTDYCAEALAGKKIVPRRIDLAAEKEKAEQKEIDEALGDDDYEW